MIECVKDLSFIFIGWFILFTFHNEVDGKMRRAREVSHKIAQQ